MGELKVAAVRALCRHDYSDEQIAAWTRAESAEQLRAKVAADPSFVARSGSELVGYSQIRPSTGEVLAVYVAPTHAGRGIGAALLATVERHATAAGLTSVWVDASLNGEPFYAACGYGSHEASTFAFESGVTLACVRMRKALISS
jgi:putative acetyltransferase